MSPVGERLDRLRKGQHGPYAAWIVLGASMVLSSALTLFYGRNSWFSIDESAWISDSPGLNLGEALNPHVGHLVFIPRLVYKLMLETVGIDYFAYRLLTVAAILLCAVLFFVWARRRVPDFVALAGTMPILLFSYDPLHLIAGNGFTVVFALACGVAALIAWDRADLRGDIAAFALLLLGAATYTVALPFAAGLTFGAAVERNWGRIWVGLVPIVLYLAWRALGDVSGSDPAAGGSDWSNLVLLPAWSFQGIGGVLASWSGLNFDFVRADTLQPGTGVGPVLAIAALSGLVWRIATGGARAWLWITMVIALALFAAQTIAWGGIERYPEMPRYLYPGLIVVLLIAAEALRGLRWSRTWFALLWIMTAVSMLTAFALLREKSEQLELKGEQARAEVAAVTLLDGTVGGPSPQAQPRLLTTDDFDPARADEYGNLGYEPSTLRDRPDRIGNQVDRFMAEALDLKLAPATGAVSTVCLVAHGDDRRFRIDLPADGAVLRATRATQVSLGRFGDGTQVRLGQVLPGSPVLLELFPDAAATPWFVVADAPGLSACPVAPDASAP